MTEAAGAERLWMRDAANSLTWGDTIVPSASAVTAPPFATWVSISLTRESTRSGMPPLSRWASAEARA